MKKRLGAGASPTREQVEYFRAIGNVLERDYRFAPDPWASYLGYTLYRTREMPDYSPAAIRDGRMYLREPMGQVDELLGIGHEHCHDKFHASCIAYTELELFQIEKDEAQARGLSTIGIYPSLKRFESIDHFRAESIMPQAFTELRIILSSKYGIW